MVVYDVTNKQSFSSCSKWIERVKAKKITPEVIEGLCSAVEHLAVSEGEMVLAAKDTRRTRKREELPVIVPTSEEDLSTATDTSEEE